MDGFSIFGKDSRGKTLYTKPCLLCGKPTRATAPGIRQGRGDYCGRSCSAKARCARGVPVVPLETRFWNKVDKNGPVPPHRPGLGKCWVWTAYCLPFGHGTIKIGGKRGRHHPAQRIAWELENGPVPDGMCVLHKCDVPRCVRVSHLFLGTREDNNLDMKAKGRARSRRGEKGTNAKLTAKAVRDIRKCRAAGATLGSLAKRYGVHETCVHKIVSRESWKHIA